ncbi:MAG TPA: hypothetical protein VG712_07950, partial [Gemmatimonadales bacterium]|nr:hypothetical protein [Gemmatimonadales bacterium]
MTRRLAPFVLLLCASAPLRLSAQERLTVGQISQGTITSLDPTTGEGQHFDDWRVQLRARHRYRVVMRSRAFDAFVALGRMTGGSFVMTASDDDGGGGTDASAMIVPATDGDYIVRARPLSAESTGGYSLAVTDEGEVQPLRAQLITPAQAVSGTLDSKDAMTDEGKPVDYYRFAARSGRRYAVTLLAQGFDAYLEAGTGANGVFQKERSNDDGGGGTNARLSWVARETGEIWILARSFNDDLGAYTLLLEDLGDAPLPGPAVMLSSGRGVDGSLDETDEEGDEGRYDTYTIDGQAGQVVVIRMDSEAFDPVVGIGRDQDGTWHELDKDDDGGLGTNAHLEFRVPET